MKSYRLTKLLTAMLLVVCLLPTAALASQMTNMIVPAGSQYYIVSVDFDNLDTDGRILYNSNYPAGTLDDIIYLDIFDVGANVDVALQAADDLPFEAPVDRYFRGWSHTADGDAEYAAGDVVPMKAEGIQLYACWSTGFEPAPDDALESGAMQIDDMDVPLAAPAANETHTVHFLDMNGSLLSATEVAHGSTVEEPTATPMMEGYSFDFWYDATLADATPYAFDAPLSGDLKLIAMMTPDAAAKLASADAFAGSGLNIRIIDAEETEAVAATPEVEIVYTYENGAQTAAPGSKVTLTAVLHNFPEGISPVFQWQREDGDEFKDVDGATAQTYTFSADASTTDCDWRVNVSY